VPGVVASAEAFGPAAPQGDMPDVPLGPLDGVIVFTLPVFEFPDVSPGIDGLYPGAIEFPVAPALGGIVDMGALPDEVAALACPAMNMHKASAGKSTFVLLMTCFIERLLLWLQLMDFL